MLCPILLVMKWLTGRMMKRITLGRIASTFLRRITFGRIDIKSLRWISSRLLRKIDSRVFLIMMISYTRIWNVNIRMFRWKRCISSKIIIIIGASSTSIISGSSGCWCVTTFTTGSTNTYTQTTTYTQ